jgi:hypothetical protein
MNMPFMNPLLRLIATQPHLLATHAESYARMFGKEIGATGATLRRRMVLGGFVLVLLLLALIFAGVALMLWAALPPIQTNLAWVLLLVPGIPLVLALLFFIMLKSDSAPLAINKVKTQFEADMAMLHETGAI